MTENDDDFGLYLEYDDDEEDIPPIPSMPCRYPSSHNFVKKLLAQHYYQECTYCGYSPEHDANKPKFKECHMEYLTWIKQRGH